MFNKAIKEIKPLYANKDIRPLLKAVECLRHQLLPVLISETDSKHIAELLLIKISNLLIGKFHFIHKDEKLLSSPYGLLVDPSNSCPLRCPGCLHGKYLKESGIVDWPGGLLEPEKFNNFIKQFGPYALYIHFFNWGEPLLNENTPEYITLAKKYGLDTVLSSNLNVKFDAQKLVLSGLDFLIMSIDGVTQDSYEIYRKGGDLNLVINNIKKMVSVKRKFHMSKPILQWQFLTFSHNKHEISHTRKLAKELGVDSLRFASPYDVSWADPSIVRDTQHNETINYNHVWKREYDWVTKGASVPSVSERIKECYKLQGSNLSGYSGNYQTKIKTGNVASCDWLYKNIVMDAHGRILPCCYIPKKSDEHKYVFASMEEQDISSLFNSMEYVYARRLLNTLFHPKDSSHIDQKNPFCEVCKNDKTANVNSRHIRKYFSDHRVLFRHCFLSDESINLLADWLPEDENNETILTNLT